MKAILWTAYGPPNVLQLKEVEKPTPKDDEVLIRVHATTVTAGDCELRSLRFPLYLALPLRLWWGFSKPRGNTIPGTEFAGEIEAVGRNVKAFKKGDQVFGSASLGMGTCAEYKCLPEKPKLGALAIKPTNMTYEQAAAIPFGGTGGAAFSRSGEYPKREKGADRRRGRIHRYLCGATCQVLWSASDCDGQYAETG